MAAGLPVAAPDVGDVASIVAKPNAPYIVPAGDEDALGEALTKLANDPQARSDIGEANRRKAIAQFDRKTMIESYDTLYARALGLGKMP